MAAVQNSGVGLRSVHVTSGGDSGDAGGDLVEVSCLDVENSKGLVL